MVVFKHPEQEAKLPCRIREKASVSPQTSYTHANYSFTARPGCFLLPASSRGFWAPRWAMLRLANVPLSSSSHSANPATLLSHTGPSSTIQFTAKPHIQRNVGSWTTPHKNPPKDVFKVHLYGFPPLVTVRTKLCKFPKGTSNMHFTVFRILSSSQ